MEKSPWAGSFRFKRLYSGGIEMAAETKESISIPKAAEILGLSRTTLYERIRGGTFPAIRFPGQKRNTFRVLKDDIEKVLDSRRVI